MFSALAAGYGFLTWRKTVYRSFVDSFDIRVLSEYDNVVIKLGAESNAL